MDKAKIISIFDNTKNIQDTLDKCNITFTQFYNTITPTLSCSYNNITLEQKNQIVDMYLSGVPMTRIGVQLGIYHKLIKRVLNEFNIDTSNRRYSKYNIDIHYFDSIDNPNKAYILGLLFADGYNSLDKETISLSLQWQDKEILDTICKELKYDKPLKYIPNSHKIASNGYISQDEYSLIIYSKYMCQTLNGLGMVPNKSLVLEFPQWLDPSLYSHFIRGYFDGDGSYCSRISFNYGRRDMITFTSTKNFCDGIKRIINSCISNTGGGIYDASCHNGVTKVLSFSGRNQTKLILDWLYQDATMFLSRKYQKYLESHYQYDSYVS